MKQVLFNYTGGAPGFTNNSLSTGISWVSPATGGSSLFASAGILSNFQVRMTVAPGAGQSRIFTIYIDGSASTLEVTISDTNLTGEDTGSINISAGARVNIRSGISGSPAPTTAMWSSLFDGTVAGESLLMGGTGNSTGFSASALEYYHVGAQGVDKVEPTVEQVIATPGTIKNFYIAASGGLGSGSGNGILFTIRKNGIDTTLAADIKDTGISSAQDLVSSFTVVAGDVISMSAQPHGTVFSLRQGWWGCTFVADTDGESLMFGTGQGIDVTNTEYTPLMKGHIPETNFSITESGAECMGQTCGISKLRVRLATAPSSGKSYTFSTRVDGVDGNLTVTVSGTDKIGNDSTHSDVLTGQPLLGLRSVPSGTPTAPGVLSWGLVCSIGVATPATIGVQLKLAGPYIPYFGGATIADLCFDLPVTSWRETISPKAFILPMAGITGAALSLNMIDFLITLSGTVYGPHVLHPLVSGEAHSPDKVDLEEIAILINKRGLANKARLVLNLPAGDRTYMGAVKGMKLIRLHGTGVANWNYTMTFQVIWTSSRPEWRGWT